MRAHSSTKHCVPAPQRLFPERFGPGECAVLDHPLVAAPDVVDEDVDPAGLPNHTLERRRHLLIQPVVAPNAGNLLVAICTIVGRPASHEDTSPVCASALAIPRPTPKVPPVTMPTCPSKVLMVE